ncbi:Uncharacterised protein [Vibrio cholerae]|nr:Uncharacterised protein [Vibrio cholerae]CSI24582.1 Uncharacterised protein [Vibrio cholerae]
MSEARTLSSHSSFDSLPVNRAMNDFFGIFATSTTAFITKRSWVRTRSIEVRRVSTKWSNCFGVRRNSRKISSTKSDASEA